MSQESSNTGDPYIWDQQHFQAMQELDVYCHNGKYKDMPLSNEFLDGFGTESYQLTTPGGLPLPDSPNPDLLDSGRQSPLFPSLSTTPDRYGSHSSDESSGLGNDSLHPPLLQQLQESPMYTGSNASNSHLGTNQTLLSASQNFSETQVQQVEPSMTSASSAKVGQYQPFAAPSEDSWKPMSTPVTKVVNNTTPSSVPANLQHPSTSKAQHFIRHPSHLRRQIHPQQAQHPYFALTAKSDFTTGQEPHAMSCSNNLTNRQEPNASPSPNGHQNLQYLPPFRQISPYSQSRGSPASQNYQPFQESSLRTSVTSNSGQNPWEAGQFQILQYPDLQPMFQQEPNHSPYMGHHHISGSQGKSIISYTPEQYRTQRSDSRETSSFMSQKSTGFCFNGSSPMSIKREMSSSDSDHVVPTPILKSQIASLKPQTTRRVKQEPEKNDDNEVVVDPIALQTADLAELDPTDHTNVAALIVAMHNTKNVEDNLGMQKTWHKVRKAKAFRIREVCVELLNLTKQAQQQKGTPLGDKRPINQYTSFQTRFEALCETLTFQKTVCKHLIEPPYSYSVVDDPQYAKDRVKNNRRVNHQKAEAIRLGREHLGEKGQGKGKPTLKTKKRGQAQIDDSQEDEEDSGDEPVSGGEMDESPHLIGHKSARPNPHTPKRIKRASRSKYQPVESATIDTSPSQSTNSNQHEEQEGSVQPTYVPQVRNLEDPFAQGLHQHAYAPTGHPQMLSEHDRMLHELAASQRMPNLNQHYDFQSGNQSGNDFYGNNSTAGSDIEGLGGPGYRLI